MAEILARGLRGSGVLDRAVVPPTPVVDQAGGMGQMERGLRSSLSGQGISALNTEGLQAEIAGRPDIAAQKYQLANELQQRAADFAPRVTSLRDVHGAGDLTDFLAGGLPQVLTSTAPAIAGAVIGRGLGGRIGSVAGGLVPAYNMEANETMGELAQDPAARARMTPEQLQTLGRLKGGINAAMEVAGPAYLLERALGHQAAKEGLRGAAKTVGMGGLTEGSTEVAQELVGQGAQSFARTGTPTNIDPWALADAGVLGAAGGHAMALPAAGAQLAHGAMLKGAEAGGKVAEKTVELGKQAADGGIPLFESVKQRGEAMAGTALDALAQRTPPAEIAKDPAAAEQWVQQNDAETKQAVQEHIQRVMENESTPQWKRDRVAGIAEDLASSDSPYVYDQALTLLRGMDKAEQAAHKLREFVGEMSASAKKALDGTKKNEQLTASQKLIGDLLTEHVDPAVAQSEDFGYARHAFTELLSGKLTGGLKRRAVREFFELYGDNAHDVAEQAATIIARDNPELTPKKLVSDFNATLKDAMGKQKASRESVRANMTNEGQLALEQHLGRKITDGDYDHIAELMRRRAEGTLKGGDKELSTLFGDKLTNVDNLFRTMHEVESTHESKATAKTETSAAEDTSPTESDNFEARQAEKGIESTFVMKGDTHVTLDKNFPDAVRERVAKEQAKHPDMHIEAVPAKEAGLDAADKVVLKMSPRTDKEATEISRSDLEKLAGRSEIVRPARTTKPEEGWTTFKQGGQQMMRRIGRAADGMVHFETNDGKTISTTANKLAYAMRGRLQKSNEHDTTAVHDALAQAVSSALTHGDVKRAYVVDKNGKEVDLTQRGAMRNLVVGGRTFTEHWKSKLEDAKAQRVQYHAKLLSKATERLSKNDNFLYDAIRLQLENAVEQAKKRPDSFEAVAHARSELNAFTASPARWLVRGEMLAEKERQKIEHDWKRAGETDEKTDTDPFSKTEQELREEQLDAEAKDLAIETKRQARKVVRKEALPSTKDKLAAMQAAVGMPDGKALTAKAERGLEYLNNPPKDYTTEKARAIAAWAEKWLANTDKFKDEEGIDLARTVMHNIVDKAKTVLDGDESLAEFEGKKNEQVAEGGYGFKGRDEAIEYIHRALGKKMGLEFKKTLGGISGEWVPGDTANTIRIAMNAGPGMLSVAYHESMHELFARLTKRGDAKELLLRVASSEAVTRQLERLLENEPAALRAIKADPEERLAYAYQFWAQKKEDGSRMLHVMPAGNSVFKKIGQFLRNVTGMLSAEERADAIMAAFYDGKMATPSAAGKVIGEVMARGENASKFFQKMQPLYQKAYNFVMPSYDVLETSDNPFAKEIGKLFYTPLVGENADKGGFLNATRMKTAQWDNRFAEALGDLNGDEISMLREVLSTGKTTTFEPVTKAAEAIKKELREFHDYMTGRGVQLGKRENYFPRVWDFEKIAADPKAFQDMLVKNYPDVVTPEKAKAITGSMTMLSGVEQEHGTVKEKEDAAGYSPYMQAINKLKLDFVKDEHAQDFLEQDLVKILTGYFKQGVRRAEYEARFGEGGKKLGDLLVKAYDHELARVKKESPDLDEKAAVEKAMERQSQFVNAAHAMEGTIGYDKITPGMRKFNSWMVAYQNMRLLPFVLLSSTIDPLGFIVRGGSVSDAFEGYKRGVQEVLATWTGKELRDEKTKLAELMGTIEHQSFLDQLGYVHESMYMNSKAKKASDAFFKWNGMEGWNRAMRTQATVTAVEFIKEHALNPGEHSERWLKELGLTAKDVKVDKDGTLVLFDKGFQSHGMSAKEARAAADKMQMAVNQWVDGAMLRPNAALRPSWSSDPRFALLFYLKQFTYAFQKTFLSRVRNEYKHGNTEPMVAMLPFIPVMIGADVIRGLIQNGGELPQYMKGWGVGDYLMHGVQRAGLTGIGQFGIEELSHPLDVTGPVVAQTVDLFTESPGENLRKAIPGLAAANVMAD